MYGYTIVISLYLVTGSQIIVWVKCSFRYLVILICYYLLFYIRQSLQLSINALSFSHPLLILLMLRLTLVIAFLSIVSISVLGLGCLWMVSQRASIVPISCDPISSFYNNYLYMLVYIFLLGTQICLDTGTCLERTVTWRSDI